MVLIAPDHPAASGAFSYRDFLQGKLKDEQVLLFETDKAILALAREGKESYTMDTGQSTITVRRVNLPELIKQSVTLKERIKETQAELDNIDNAGASFVQVRPF
jgi:hypothetical protein